MGLSLLHQTVNPVGSTFTPNLTLYGWFTLHWNRNAGLIINAATGLTNGQEFILDIVRHNAEPMPEDETPVIEWDQEMYLPSCANADNTYASPWSGVAPYSAVRHHFFVLNGICTLESRNPIAGY